MGPDILGIVWLIITSLAAVIMIIIIRRNINQERLAMIEKGMAPADFQPAKGRSYGTLRFALLLVGVGLGLIIGSLLDNTFGIEEVAYFSMIFIFGGAGLGLAYLIEARNADKEQGQE